jgi:hypothetical protein
VISPAPAEPVLDQKYAATKHGLIADCQIAGDHLTCHGLMTQTPMGSSFPHPAGPMVPGKPPTLLTLERHRSSMDSEDGPRLPVRAASRRLVYHAEPGTSFQAAHPGLSMERLRLLRCQ